MVMFIIPVERNSQLTYVIGPILYNYNGYLLEWIGTNMSEVGSLTFNGASNTVVGWHGYGRGWGPQQGGMPPGQEARTIGRKKKCCID